MVVLELHICLEALINQRQKFRKANILGVHSMAVILLNKL